MRLTLLSKKCVHHNTGWVDVKPKLNSYGFLQVSHQVQVLIIVASWVFFLRCAKCFEQKVSFLYEIIFRAFHKIL